MNLISTTAELAAACTRLATHPFVTVDTEFLRETTYYPKLCLLQIASPDEAVLVDPLAEGLDLAPFMALMVDPAVVKVFHAARQDLEIIWNIGHLVPSPLFDTQIAAMVCGYGDSVGYEQLANDLAKARIDKSSRFTDWSRRPLNPAQMVYAEADVTHLRTIYLALAADLEASGRTAWLAEEMAVLSSPGTYDIQPENVWTRLKGRVRKPRELAVLMELAAWRERECQSRDVPRSRVLKDDTLIDIVQRAPRSCAAVVAVCGLPTQRHRGGLATALGRRLRSGRDSRSCSARWDANQGSEEPGLSRQGAWPDRRGVRRPAAAALRVRGGAGLSRQPRCAPLHRAWRARHDRLPR